MNGIFAVTYFYKQANERERSQKKTIEEENGIKYLPIDFLTEIENENILKEAIPDFSFEKVEL